MDRLKGTLDDPKLLTDNSVKPGHHGQRQISVYALYGFGSAAEPAVPLLIRVLEAKDIKDRMVSDTIRCSVLNALKRIGPSAKAAIPAALRIANDPSESEVMRESAKAFADEMK
jgi:hypothetical protein